MCYCLWYFFFDQVQKLAARKLSTEKLNAGSKHYIKTQFSALLQLFQALNDLGFLTPIRGKDGREEYNEINAFFNQEDPNGVGSRCLNLLYSKVDGSSVPLWQQRGYGSNIPAVNAILTEILPDLERSIAGAETLYDKLISRTALVWTNEKIAELKTINKWIQNLYENGIKAKSNRFLLSRQEISQSDRGTWGKETLNVDFLVNILYTIAEDKIQLPITWKSKKEFNKRIKDCFSANPILTESEVGVLEEIFAEFCRVFRQSPISKTCRVFEVNYGHESLHRAIYACRNILHYEPMGPHTIAYIWAQKFLDDLQIKDFNPDDWTVVPYISRNKKFNEHDANIQYFKDAGDAGNFKVLLYERTKEVEGEKELHWVLRITETGKDPIYYRLHDAAKFYKFMFEEHPYINWYTEDSGIGTDHLFHFTPTFDEWALQQTLEGLAPRRSNVNLQFRQSTKIFEVNGQKITLLFPTQFEAKIFNMKYNVLKPYLAFLSDDRIFNHHKGFGKPVEYMVSVERFMEEYDKQGNPLNKGKIRTYVFDESTGKYLGYIETKSKRETEKDADILYTAAVQAVVEGKKWNTNQLNTILNLETRKGMPDSFAQLNGWGKLTFIVEALGSGIYSYIRGKRNQDYYAAKRNELARELTAQKLGGIFVVASGVQNDYRLGKFLLNHLVRVQMGGADTYELILLKNWVPPNQPNGEHYSIADMIALDEVKEDGELQWERKWLLYVKDMLVLGESQLLLDENEYEPFLNLLVKCLNMKYDTAGNPISGMEAKPLENLIVEMLDNLESDSEAEKALFTALGYDVDSDKKGEKYNEFKTQILLLLHHCGFTANLVKIDDQNYLWKVSKPDNPMMKEWWPNFQANHGHSYVHDLLDILQKLF